MRHRPGQLGFTLVEAIITIVVVAALSGVVAVFLRLPVRNYVDSTARAELTDAADLALRRMARDLRLALPNSIRLIGTDGHAIQFLQTKAGGRYLAAEDADADGLSTFILDFANSANTNANKFTVVGASYSLAKNIVAGTDSVVVYNLGAGFAPADAYQSSNNNRALINSVTTDGSGNVTAIVLAGNPFLGQSTPMPSPGQRFQVIGGPVTYYCGLQNGVPTLSRYAGYPISAIASDPPYAGGNQAMLATRVTSCAGLFSYDGYVSGTNNGRRSGLVVINLSLTSRSDPNISIKLVHQVHVDNTP